jgi:FkbM family methyltransferase
MQTWAAVVVLQRLRHGGRMDWYWDSVSNFLKIDRRTRVVAPAEMHPHHALLAAYANAGEEEAAQVDAVVLHKGLYRELSRSFLRPVLERLTPGFANEVFIVLTEGGVLPVDHPHVGDLPFIRAWASADDAADMPLKRENRMPPTYLGKGQVLCEIATGQMMILAADDRSITPLMLRDGFFDPGLTRFLIRTLRPGMTFVDVGANMGVYTMLGAHAVGPRGKVLAIEANPELAEIVQTNILVNGLTGYATVVSAAVAQTDGERVLHCFPRLKGSGTFHDRVAQASREWWNETAVPVTVPARRLGHLIEDAGIGRPDWIKIDIEGAELEALQGSATWFTANRPHMVLEWNTGTLLGQEAALRRLLAEEFGYSLRRIMPEGHSRPLLEGELERAEHFDMVALPA